ncbi:hypothetical protein ACFOU2_13620 [Bacillus songklensis]|uniref:Uncharacterized protein n=1 Tax=Bacillus songklensis TaxID=1069116 RepID=A0ABV8B2N8_9BACI
MKIFGITILTMGLLMGFSLSMDILLGFDIITSLKNAFNPFLVMEAAEMCVLFFFIFLLVIESILLFFQKRKEEANKQKNQPQS